MGLVLMLIGHHKMMIYVIQDGQETLKDVWKAARGETWGWYIGGIVVMCLGYIPSYLTFN